MLCLHGTSCLGDQGLQRLKDDGIIKVNVWTKMERDASSAAAQYIKRNWQQIVEKPSLDWFPANRIRDVWVAAAKEDMRGYMLAFGYERLQAAQAALRAV
jgi:fructose/tagatose bisphosphate aldolase